MSAESKAKGLTPFSERDGVIWFDGSMVPWREAQVHVLTHTLHYGMGVFEGVRAYDTDTRGTCVFRLREHTRRLFRSAHIMGMKMPYSEEELLQAQCAVLRENGLREGYIRPICFYGSEGMGLHMKDLRTHVAVAAWEWPSYLAPEVARNGVRMCTSSYTRHHVNISMCKAKATGHYVNSLLAVREAEQAGCDEALLLDNEGYVAEGSGENIFLLRDGVLHTPELTSCLEGITRDTILHFAQELGVPVRERRITRDEVYIADEVFLTGTAAEVMPVGEVDRRMIGAGKPGALTRRLQDMYQAQVRGRRKVHEEWLWELDEA